MAVYCLLSICWMISFDSHGRLLNRVKSDWNLRWNQVEIGLLITFKHVNPCLLSDLHQMTRISPQNVQNQVGCNSDHRISAQIEWELLDHVRKTLSNFVLQSATIPAIGSCKACFWTIGSRNRCGPPPLDIGLSSASHSIECSMPSQPSDGE